MDSRYVDLPVDLIDPVIQIDLRSHRTKIRYLLLKNRIATISRAIEVMILDRLICLSLALNYQGGQPGFL